MRPSQSCQKSGDVRTGAERLIGQVLRGLDPPWPPSAATVEADQQTLECTVLCNSNGDSEVRTFARAVLEAATAHRVSALVANCIRDGAGATWPQTLRDEFERRAANIAMREAIRSAQLQHILQSFANQGLPVLVLKGGALAFTHYAEPSLRERDDTDLLVQETHAEQAELLLAELGFKRMASPDGRLGVTQAVYTLIDGRGVSHSIDLHWRVSNRPRFWQAFTFDTLWKDARPIADLLPPQPAQQCATPVALGTVDALLFACVHRMGHHAHECRLSWVIDIDRLARGLTTTQWAECERKARKRGIAGICALSLLESQRYFDTPIHSHTLASEDAASAAAPQLQREARPVWRWLDDLCSLPDWRQRLQLLREHMFPGAAYMDAGYGDAAVTGEWRRKPLWLRYLWRALRGAIRLMVRR